VRVQSDKCKLLLKGGFSSPPGGGVAQPSEGTDARCGYGPFAALNPFHPARLLKQTDLVVIQVAYIGRIERSALAGHSLAAATQFLGQGVQAPHLFR